MSRANHRIVGVVELEPKTELLPVSVVREASIRFDRFEPSTPFVTTIRASVPGGDGQVVLADVGRLQRDLERELDGFLASA